MNRLGLDRLRWVGEYLRPYRTTLIITTLLSFLSTILGMVQPYFSKVMIDTVFLGKNHRALFPLLATLIVLFIVSFFMRTGNRYLFTRYSARFLFDLRAGLFSHLHRVPFTFFTGIKIGDLYSRIASDMADIQGLVTETIPMFLFNLLTFLVTSAILFWLNWKMALMTLGFLPVAILIVRRLQPKILALNGEVARGNADIAHFLFEMLGNTRLIRLFNARKRERERLNEKQEGLVSLLLRHQVLGAAAGSVPALFIIINTLIVFGYGGTLVLDGNLTIGSLVAFSIYQGRVLGPIQGIMNGYLSLQKARVALDRVSEIRDLEAEEPDDAGEIIEALEFRGDIAFDNVSFSYGETRIMNNLSFSLPAGRVTALVGPSGSGKSTICHLLLKLIRPDSGRITLDGVDLAGLRTDWLRKNIGLVSQDIFLLHTSIEENIRFAAPHADFKAVKRAAKAACIDDFIQSLPLGYDTVVGDNGVRLSGGQKQRISIARAMLSDPKILILDEATAFLDTEVEERLKDAVTQLTAGRTILLVSHRPSSIQHADKLIACAGNGLTYEGSVEGYMNAAA